MVKHSTFPADDLADRTDEIIGVLRRHDPVPVPTTTLYLSVRDKRHLADAFDALVKAGLMERARLKPGDPHFQEAAALAGLSDASAEAALGVYRLTGAGRSRDA